MHPGQLHGWRRQLLRTVAAGGELCSGAGCARLNDIDPQAWLARINDDNIHRLEELLPWNWKTRPARLAA